MKRLFDVLIAAVGLVALAPLFAVLAIAIKIDSPGPVFFRQERVGRHGRLFRIFKFRTMLVEPPRSEIQVTVAGDRRITRLGRVLRSSKLDELPQLIDVLRGTMSLVGPRPEVARYVQHYPEEWRIRLLSVRPGITDFASVHFRNESELLAGTSDPEREYLRVILPRKLRYSLYYVNNRSLASDLLVLSLTLKTISAPALSTARNAMTIIDSDFWEVVEQRLSTLGRWNRLCAVCTDATLVLFCWILTYLFRLGFEGWQPGRPTYDDYVVVGVIATYLVCLGLVGIYRSLWRFFGFDDFRRLVLAALLGGLASGFWIQMAQLTAVPRAVLVLHPLFTVLALAITRMVYRLLWEHARRMVDGHLFEPRRALVIGAGERARRLIASIHGRDGWHVLAVLDDDKAAHGLRIAGVRVQGCLIDLELPHLSAGATHVLVANEKLSDQQRAFVASVARRLGLTIMTVEDGMSMKSSVESAESAADYCA